MMKPFGGPNFRYNQERVGKYDPCAYCGKAIKNKDTAVYVEVLVNGEFAQDAPGSAESQGAFPLGPNCARRFKSERVTV
jgi:hypothetical protein